MPKTISIDRSTLVDRMKACFGRVAYKLGAKAPLDAGAYGFGAIDCSGFVRWLIYQASHGKTVMPDGSVVQRDWCRDHGFKPCPYANAGLKDSRLRIAFMPPVRGRAGHVWLIINQQTIESYGRNGPGRRAWSYKTLAKGVAACYVLTDVLP